MKEKKRSTEEINNGVMRYGKLKFVIWLIRWTIGFTVIYFITLYYPSFSWLWTLGISVASFSLFLMIYLIFRVKKKMHKIKEKATGI
jgi:hypothetical protein